MENSNERVLDVLLVEVGGASEGAKNWFDFVMIDDSTAATYGFKLRVDKYDEESKTYVKDDETREAAIAALAEWGVEEDIDTLLNDPTPLMSLQGLKMYVSEEQGRASLNPRYGIPFVSFEKIDVKLYNALRKPAAQMKERFITTCFEQSRVGRFAIGVEIEDDKGVKKLCRVSQIEIPPVDDSQRPTRVGVKFFDSVCNTMRENIEATQKALDEGSTTAKPEVIERLQQALDTRMASLREQTITKIAEATADVVGGPIDIEDLIANGGSIPCNIIPNSIEGSDTYFLTAVLVRA